MPYQQGGPSMAPSPITKDTPGAVYQAGTSGGQQGGPTAGYYREKTNQELQHVIGAQDAATRAAGPPAEGMVFHGGAAWNPMSDAKPTPGYWAYPSTKGFFGDTLGNLTNIAKTVAPIALTAVGANFPSLLGPGVLDAARVLSNIASSPATSPPTQVTPGISNGLGLSNSIIDEIKKIFSPGSPLSDAVSNMGNQAKEVVNNTVDAAKSVVSPIAPPTQVTPRPSSLVAATPRSGSADRLAKLNSILDRNSPFLAAQKAALTPPARVLPALGQETPAPPAEEVADMQVAVYGPDGKFYSSPKAARDAGVTNYTLTPPTATTQVFARGGSVNWKGKYYPPQEKR